MTQEEKAKAYDELKVKASRIYHKENDVLIMHTIEDLFPELMESEDERIRRELIRAFKSLNTIKIWNGIERTDIIAWLEKQGEQNLAWSEEDNNMLKWVIGYLDNRMLNAPISEERTACKNAIAWLEKLKDEQKSADKVEPKFKEGEWIVFNGLTLYIKEVVKGFYRTVSKGGIPNSYDWDIDKIARLWTIQDAKDGDVLYECNEKKPFIFKELETKHIGDIASYCDIFNGIFNPNEDEWTTLDVVPATKEQRDTLMKAMADAGYTFDFEKKELRKIEHKYVWSEEDEEKFRDVIRLIEQGAPVQSMRDHYTNWLKSLKDRYTWKPSDEQMEALANALSLAKSCGEESAFDLRTLYEQLKKLKGE